MTIGRKIRRKKITWLWGNKQKGVSVYKLKYKISPWRVAIWRNGRLYRTEEYDTQAEAMSEGRGLVRSIKKGHWNWVWA